MGANTSLPIIFSSSCTSGISTVTKKHLLHHNSATMAVNAENVTIAQLEQYGNVPALAPPPGVVPNFAAHNERADVYNVLCSTLLAILYIFLCLRLYAKMWIKRNPGFDDREISSDPPDWRLMTDIPSGWFSCGGGFHSWQWSDKYDLQDAVDWLKRMLRFGRRE